MDEAEQLADKIAILNEGKIIANGMLEELKKLFSPAKKNISKNNRYSRRFSS